MKIIGLTGGIASGKSTISKLLMEKGAVIIDADKIAKSIMEPGKEAWQEVINHFGEIILKDDRNIDRKKLADIVFGDEKQLKVLNSITHPKIKEEMDKQLRDCIEKKVDIVVIDAPLLLETGLGVLVDEVWVVAADERTQIERLLKREPDMTFSQAQERLKAQMPLEEKMKFAHRVIDNNGSLEKTKK
jgi:dephospho-CoA kinase